MKWFGKTILWILIANSVAQAKFACERDRHLIADPAWIPDKPIVLDYLPVDFLGKAAPRTNGKFHHDKLNFRWVEEYKKEGERTGGAGLIYYDGEFVVRYVVRPSGETLRFDINVNDPFQGSKLYEFTLANALEIYPATKHIPARMYYRNSENARFVIKNTFGTLDDMQHFATRGKSEEDLKALRSKIIEQLYQSPAMKARERNGFSQLTKIVFHRATGGLVFMVEKGERMPSEKIKVVFDETEPYEITAEGKVNTAGITKTPTGLGVNYYDPDPWG